jgi:hypothetical protein
LTPAKKDVLTGCSVAALVLLLFIGAMGILFYVSFKNFPDRASKEVLHEKHSNYLGEIDQLILESDSHLSLAAKLEKIDRPENIVFLGLEMEGSELHNDKNIINIFNQLESDSSQSRTIINGCGYGSYGHQDVLIIEYPLEKFEQVESLLIYFLDTQNQSTD